MRLSHEENIRVFDGIKNGFSVCEAKDIWAAKIAVERNLGEYRIGNVVMYKPKNDIEDNRNLHLTIQNISSL